MKIIASVDNPSPNHAADKITDNGPKNTRPNVAIASQVCSWIYHDLRRIFYPYKTF